MLNELALFAGAGGGLLGSRLLGWRVVCYVENDLYCIEVLKVRIGEGYLDDAPIWDNIRTFNGYPWSGLVDIITAGFPCQPWSVAGKRRGSGDERNLWPETFRVICEVRPRWCMLENVPGLLAGSHGYFGRILGQLAEVGYDVRWGVLSAAGVGAPHLRKRLWIVANGRCWDTQECSQKETGRRQFYTDKTCGSGGESILLANATGPGKATAEQSGQRHGTLKGSANMAYPQSGESGKSSEQEGREGSGGRSKEVSWWDTDPADAEGAFESGMGRVVDGLADRMDRLKALGNGQVPAVVRKAWLSLKPD